MPNFDLRERNHPTELDPLASFKTLSVMCFPSDLAARERMIGFIQTETGSSQSRRSPFDNEEFRDAVRLHGVRGGQVGSLLLTLIQLRMNGYEPSLRLAIELQNDAVLEAWTAEEKLTWNVNSHLDHLPRGREIIMRNVRNYASVAHLWAAHIYSIQAREKPLPDDVPSWPDTKEGFLNMLGYAEVFLKYGSRIPASKGKIGKSLIGSVKPWQMQVPDNLKAYPIITAMPFPDCWLPIITSYRKLKR